MSRYSPLLIISLLTLMGVIAMAKDGSYKPPNTNAPVDEDEAFFNSPMGQDVTKLFEEFTSGKKTFEAAREEFNKKWGADLEAGVGAPTPQQVPQAPLTRVR